MAYIFKIVNSEDFHDAFRRMGRTNSFSYAGRQALFEYLQELAECSGEPIELNVVNLCCEYKECSDLDEFQKEYGEEYDTIECIERETTVIMIDDCAFIYAVF